MKVIGVSPGTTGYSLTIADADPPQLRDGEVLIRIAYAGVNRADLLQAQGLYPPPAAASTTLGLECSGWREDTNQAVMALLPGGGYAEYCAVDEGCLVEVPDNLSIESAAGFMETFITTYLNIFELGAISSGQRILVHGGGSGIGTSAIQLCREAGVDVVVTTGTEEKCNRCLELGATHAINYHTQNFSEVTRDLTDGRGVDLVLDCIGGSYLSQNMRCLNQDGRLVVIGLMGGSKAELNLAQLLGKRIQIIGSTLRNLPLERKRDIIASFMARFGDSLQAGRLSPITHTTLPLDEAQEAHTIMKTSSHFGKIILSVAGPAPS